MKVIAFNPENVTSRLEFFNYKYTVTENTIRIMLPVFCYLEITFADRVTMRSRLRFALSALPIEANIVIYGLVSFVFAWHQWDLNPKFVYAIVVLGFSSILVFIVCLINAASMRAIVHQWIEKDRSW